MSRKRRKNKYHPPKGYVALNYDNLWDPRLKAVERCPRLKTANPHPYIYYNPKTNDLIGSCALLNTADISIRCMIQKAPQFDFLCPINQSYFRKSPESGEDKLRYLRTRLVNMKSHGIVPPNWLYNLTRKVTYSSFSQIPSDIYPKPESIDSKFSFGREPKINFNRI
ncbi:MAG: hypothetical protein WCK90_04325 [archaeon]